MPRTFSRAQTRPGALNVDKSRPGQRNPSPKCWDDPPVTRRLRNRLPGCVQTDTATVSPVNCPAIREWEVRKAGSSNQGAFPGTGGCTVGRRPEHRRSSTTVVDKPLAHEPRADGRNRWRSQLSSPRVDQDWTGAGSAGSHPRAARCLWWWQQQVGVALDDTGPGRMADAPLAR